MDYIVFDLEWNQCPDGKNGSDPDLPFENYRDWRGKAE